MVLPVATLVLAVTPYVSRIVRATLLEVLDSDYVELARLKGIPEPVVMRRHALLNAIVPGIQVIALQLAWLAGGVVLVETLFAYPGVGKQLVDSVRNHDVPMVQALTMIIAGRLHRGEPGRRRALHPADPPSEDGDLVMTDTTTPSTAQPGAAQLLPAGAQAEAVRLRLHGDRAGRAVRDHRAVLLALRREGDRRCAVRQDRCLRHRLPRPGRAEPADARRPGRPGDLGAGHPARHGARRPHRRGRGVRRRLVGRGDHAPQRRAAGLPADPARAGGAHRSPEPRVVGDHPAHRRLARPACRAGLPRRRPGHRLARLRRRRRGPGREAVPGDRRRGAAQHDRSSAGRGRPPAHLLDRCRRRPGLPGLRRRPGCGQLGPDDEREPARPPDPAMGGPGAGADDRHLHHRHQPDGRRARPGQPEGTTDP